MRFRPARIATLTVLFIAAAVGLTALASAVFAEEPWTYVCDEIDEPGDAGAHGSGNCQAHNGAPDTGPIDRKFKLHQRGVQPKPETVAVCEGESGGAFGKASVPVRVDGFGCYVYEMG